MYVRQAIWSFFFTAQLRDISPFFVLPDIFREKRGLNLKNKKTKNWSKSNQLNDIQVETRQ